MKEGAIKFTVPGIPPEKSEEAYAAMAKHAGRQVLPLTRRIYSITFTHDSVEWTATVGQRLTGFRYTSSKSRQLREPHSDPATVLAIFGDSPFVVFTSKGPFGPDRSAWENPFFAGKPRTVEYFG